MPVIMLQQATGSGHQDTPIGCGPRPSKGANIWRKCYALPVPLRVCTVSFKSPTGITHGVDVEAETLYEAAGLGLARLKKDGWIEGLGPDRAWRFTLREPSTSHSLTVQQLHRWIDGVTTSPAEVLRRARVKQLLGR